MKCSICKIEGHNKRTCNKSVVEVLDKKVKNEVKVTRKNIYKKKEEEVEEYKKIKELKTDSDIFKFFFTKKNSMENKKVSKITCISCPGDVIDGVLITKDKRQELFGQVAGGSGSRKPEEYQRQKIIDGTGLSCPKTNMRINLRTNTLKNISHPNKKNDGFDYSEDFDGVQSVKGNKIYINLKCIVGKGGVQTRSLREVYWFVEGQLKTLKSVKDVCFANILDGDEANASISKFEYLLNLTEFESVKNRVYVGDLKGYFDWFKKVSGDQ